MKEKLIQMMREPTLHIILLILLVLYLSVTCATLRIQRDTLQEELASITQTETIVRDTVRETLLDTIFIEAPEMHSKKLLYDTLIVLQYDTISLPREQIYYKEDSVYEAWVSGVFPRLDSININIKNDVTEVYTIKTVNNIIYKKKRWSVGPYIGVLI